MDKDDLMSQMLDMGFDFDQIIGILPIISSLEEGIELLMSNRNDQNQLQLKPAPVPPKPPQSNLQEKYLALGLDLDTVSSLSKDPAVLEEILQVIEKSKKQVPEQLPLKRPPEKMLMDFEEEIDSNILQEETKEETSSLYFKELAERRLLMCDEFPDFSIANQSTGEPLPKTIERINKELISLGKSLPCEAEGSIFVAVNSNNICQLKALISGSEGTPYNHGLYLFDILLPNDYPNNPPIVNLRTTGGGEIRFNPNLYNCGSVCLSIINTWGGSDDEKWNPKFSTILQVLVSIQALVMDSNIIQKEPSYSNYPPDAPENLTYTLVVKYGNMKFAICDMIQNPPFVFREIVPKHFLIKIDGVSASVREWAQNAIKSPFTTDASYQNAEFFTKVIAPGAFDAIKDQVLEALSSLVYF